MKRAVLKAWLNSDVKDEQLMAVKQMLWLYQNRLGPSRDRSGDDRDLWDMLDQAMAIVQGLRNA